MFILGFRLFSPPKTKPFAVSGNATQTVPNNKNAVAYLSRKLHGKDNRSFTKKDAEKALAALKTLYGNIDQLTID